MTTNATISVANDGEFIEVSEGSFAAYELNRVQVSFPAEDGYEPNCKHCSLRIAEWDWGWMDADADSDDETGNVCESNPAGHEPEEGPGTWCNSASVSVDEGDDAVHVSISVGDPRGAFFMTVRKVDRSGYCKHCGDGISRRLTDGELVGPTGFVICGPSGHARHEPDGERYLLHVPYEGMGFEHMPMKKLSEGTFLVGGA